MRVESGSLENKNRKTLSSPDNPLGKDEERTVREVHCHRELTNPRPVK